MSSAFKQLRDLSDPCELADECESLTEGMMSQADAMRQGSPVAGHPNPVWLYARVAEVLRYATIRLRVDHPRPVPPAPKEETPTAPPASNPSPPPPAAPVTIAAEKATEKKASAK